MRRKSCTAAPVGEVMKADRERQRGNRALFFRGKQPLIREPSFQRLELALEAPNPVLNHRADHQLVLAADFIDADLAIHEHLQSVAQRHGLLGGVATKEHGADLGAGILQGKINMAAGLRAQVGDFAAHPAGPDARFQQRLDPAGELRDRLNLVGRIRKQRVVPGLHAAVFFRA